MPSKHTFPMLAVVVLNSTLQAFAFDDNHSSTDGLHSFNGAPLDPVVVALLSVKCIRCHGKEIHKADLDLSTLDGILKGGESGPAIVPGKPEESLLFERIHAGDMPPEEADRLSQIEAKMIHDWIASGILSNPSSDSSGDLYTPPSQHDVIPILLRRCSICHGRHRQEAGLDLRNKVALLQGGKSGPAIVPGKPSDSLVIQKILSGEMPPRDRLVAVSIKPIEQGETDILVKWIAAGAPEIELEPDIATLAGDPLVSESDRDFWAFRTPIAHVPPPVQSEEQFLNPIDVFLLSKLEQQGLHFSPEADRFTLIRRVTFDLTGLPPSISEVQDFLADTDPLAYERVVDRLLNSPRYGERWGRYWLDLAGYADSEGKREQDLLRPFAWRYRDYVIQSFNADKPFDRFLTEQVAGDELADYEHVSEITPEIYDNLVATGFLRMAPDATWANITGYVPDRVEVVADEIDVLGSAVMGLTLKCARCHSHKFDPIPQRDYYRLVDIFKGAYDEYDWLKPDVRPGLGPVSEDVQEGRLLPFVTTNERQEWKEREARISADIVAAKSRSESDDCIKAFEAMRRPEPRIQALWDRGEPSPTYIHRRGDPLNPGRLVGPGVPSVLTDGRTPFEVRQPWPGAKPTGRRLALARWLTQSDHPLTARVAVNQIWKHHFGSGLVKTLGNFGKTGSPPTHPELLDWLAREFIRQGWSRKAMHRLMVNSRAYRQSSKVLETHEQIDPDNALISRMPLRRLDAEALYDSLVFVAGQLDDTQFGPGTDVFVRSDGLITPERSKCGWRRLIYVQQRRKHLATHLETFDYPQMNPNCIERRDSLVAPQALHLMNDGLVYQLAEQFAERVRAETGEMGDGQLDRAFWITLGRPPSEDELRLGVRTWNQLADIWDQEKAANGRSSQDMSRHKALAAICHALMNSANFLYVD